MLSKEGRRAYTEKCLFQVSRITTSPQIPPLDRSSQGGAGGFLLGPVLLCFPHLMGPLVSMSCSYIQH